MKGGLRDDSDSSFLDPDAALDPAWCDISPRLSHREAFDDPACPLNQEKVLDRRAIAELGLQSGLIPGYIKNPNILMTLMKLMPLITSNNPNDPNNPDNPHNPK
jgi:hypothetical protein